MTVHEPRGYTGKLMVGMAERIADAGFATYHADGSPYSSSERGIYFDHSPAGTMETLVITPYLPQSGVLNIEHTRVQLRARHMDRSALWVRDWLDDLRALFPDQTTLEIGGLIFDRVRQTGSTSWGEPSKTGALETTQNFTFRGNRYD